MYALFTDTDTDITPEVAAEYGYNLISMPYTVGDKEIYPYKDKDYKFDSHAFYQSLRDGVMPKTGGLSPDQLRKVALIWLNMVEKRYGVPPILYTNYKFKLDYLNTPEFKRYPYWIAHYYVRSLTYKGSWKFWQHTDCGRLPGIKEKVDLNIYNGSMYDLRRLCIGS